MENFERRVHSDDDLFSPVISRAVNHLFFKHLFQIKVAVRTKSYTERVFFPSIYEQVRVLRVINYRKKSNDQEEQGFKISYLT